MMLSVLILTFVTAQRVAELALARRNTRRLLARGGVESGARHYPFLVGLHAAWLAGLWLVAWDRPASLAWLGVYVLLQGLRVWTLFSLGGRWTTRIITVPGERPISRGPYRFLSHPNYLVVTAEIAVLPLVFGLPIYALMYSLLNAAALWIRIRAEEAALRAASP
jgi:methyltransferase